MREWLTVIVVLLIVGILLDGWRRMRNARRDSLRVSPKSYGSRSESGRGDDDFFTSELPNGGARVVGYREPPPVMPSKPPVKPSRPIVPDSTPAARIPQQVTLNLDEAVPLLMEVDQEPAPVVDDTPPTPAVQHPRATPDDFADERREPSFSALDSDELDPEALDSPIIAAPAEPRAAASAPPAKARAPEPQEPEEVLIINVMAHEGERFLGRPLLDVILACGMRYGSMNIFHRHSDQRGQGEVLFSMANMVKPGTFDLDAMDDFTTPGVSLFMTLPLNVDSSLQAFEVMLDCARQLADTLGGELKDENRSVMTRQTMEHCRQRIRDFELRQLSRAPH